MFQRILVPLDGSARAEEALPTAAYLARTTGASLFLLRVVTPSFTYASPYPYSWESPDVLERAMEEGQGEAYDYLSRLVLTEHLDDIHHYVAVDDGTPVPRILHFVHENQIDLIVMRSHGATGIKRWLLGSVARGIVRRSSVPALVIRDACGPAINNPQELQHTPRILVPLDGTPFAESALLPAAQLVAALASPAQGTIHLTRTILYIREDGERRKELIAKINKDTRTEAEAYLKNVEQRFYNGDLAQFHLHITSSVVPHSDHAEVWKRIIEEAGQAQLRSLSAPASANAPACASCDVIAMATHGRHGLEHLLEGSVTESVLDASTYPLLVVHPDSVKTVHEPAEETHHAR
jgi:nucleotide-binding universal stress UspA family protein